MNDEKHAAILCKSGELPDRQHRYKALADEGIKEYQLTQIMIERLTGQKQEAGVAADSELKPEEYDQVKEAMHIGQAVKKPRIKKEKKKRAHTSKLSKTPTSRRYQLFGH